MLDFIPNLLFALLSGFQASVGLENTSRNTRNLHDTKKNYLSTFCGMQGGVFAICALTPPPQNGIQMGTLLIAFIFIALSGIGKKLRGESGGILGFVFLGAAAPYLWSERFF